MQIPITLEAAAVRGLLSLPESVLRRLAGRPLVLDGQTLAPETQLVLRAQRLLRMPAAEDLPIPQARAEVLHQSALMGGRPPIGAVRDLDVAGLPARHYVPTGRRGGPGPLLLFFHGGGFLYGDLDSHDASCRLLAEESGVAVLSIDYRLAPEHPFPAAFDDAEAAYAWVLEHADEVDLDPARLAVGGDSAGGNLAAWIAVHAARNGTPLAFQLLVYPVTQVVHDTESYRLFNSGLFLTKKFMDGVVEHFFADEESRADERVNLIRATLPEGLAPAYVATAGFDPLRDEGEAYAVRLREAGATVETERFDDQIHSFFNIVGVGRRSPVAVKRIAEVLGRAMVVAG